MFIYSSLVITIREYYKFSQFSLITVLFFLLKSCKFFTIYNNAIKTVPQTAKDKEISAGVLTHDNDI